MTALAAGTVFPVLDDALANTSYLLALGGGTAAVIDPRRDIETYRRIADDRGLTLTTALETHLHADLVSGSRELADAGVTVLAAGAARLGFAHRPVEDGDRVNLGDCTVEVLATAGHTPEHLSFLLNSPGGAPARSSPAGRSSRAEPPAPTSPEPTESMNSREHSGPRCSASPHCPPRRACTPPMAPGRSAPSGRRRPGRARSRPSSPATTSSPRPTRTRSLNGSFPAWALSRPTSSSSAR